MIFNIKKFNKKSNNLKFFKFLLNWILNKYIHLLSNKSSQKIFKCISKMMNDKFIYLIFFIFYITHAKYCNLDIIIFLLENNLYSSGENIIFNSFDM